MRARFDWPESDTQPHRFYRLSLVGIPSALCAVESRDVCRYQTRRQCAINGGWGGWVFRERVTNGLIVDRCFVELCTVRNSTPKQLLTSILARPGRRYHGPFTLEHR